jgi:2-hydroxychromene-2-carboxylate isomerase
MSDKTLEFVFDFGSPNAYLVYRTIGPVLERTGARLVLLPALLGGIFKATNNRPPFAAFGEIKGKMDYEMLELRRYIARHSLARFRMNPSFPMNTLAIMRGLVAAQDLGIETPYVEAVLKAMWEEGRKMDDPEVITAVLTEAGLDAPAILAHAQTLPVKQKLMDGTQAVVDRGVFGIPSFFVGNEMWFGKERLGQVEEALSA